MNARLRQLTACLPLAASLALLPTSAQAQWLVQDDNLYDLTKQELDDANKKLQDIYDQIKISGDGKGSLKTGTADDNNQEFNALAWPEDISPNRLLDPGKADANAKTFAQDAKTYLLEDTVPNCNQNDKGKNAVLYDNCVNARNMLGTQLRAIRLVSQNVEARNKALQSIMAQKAETAGQLQLKQYQMSTLHTLIANDQMRLNTALAAYQASRDMFQLRYTEALQSKASNKKEDSAKIDAQKRLARAAVSTALAAVAVSMREPGSLKQKSSGLGPLDGILSTGLGALGK